MAIVSMRGAFAYPNYFSDGIGAYANDSTLLDAADEKFAGIFTIPKTGTISKLCFRTGIVTTGATVDVRLETVDLTTGAPTGTLVAAGANGAQVIADADDTVWFATTITTPVAVTKGDLVAIVIVNPAVSPGNLNITSSDCIFARFPYSANFTTVWAKTTSGPVMTVEYNDGSYEPIPGTLPASGVPGVTFNNTSTPDERALFFQLPVSVQVTGVWLNMAATNGGNFDVVLYDSDGITPLATIVWDEDTLQGASDGDVRRFFSNQVTLLANTNYRMSLKPSTATNISLTHITVADVASMDALPGGSEMHLSTRTDAGAWTETTTTRPAISLLISGVESGSATGNVFNILE